MKTIARLLSVFLIIAMLFTFAACSVVDAPETDGENNGENGDGNGETNGEGGGNNALYADLADKIVTGTLTQLENAKCIKFTVGMDSALSESYELPDYGYYDHETEYVEVTVSEINGKLALSAFALSTAVDEYYGDAEHWRYYVQETIIKDGLIYKRNYSYYNTTTEAQLAAIKDDSVWYATVDETGISAMSYTEAIAAVKEALNNDALTAIKAAVADQLAASGNTDGKVSVNVDFAPAITDILDYLKTVKSTDTFGKVLNDALANIDPELTVENIIAALLSYENKTINEVFAEIEAYTVAEGMGTLQSIWDKMVASEEFAKLTEMMGMPEEALTEMTAFKLTDILSAYGNYTVADVIYTMLLAEEAPDDDYYGDGYYDDDDYYDDDYYYEDDDISTIVKAPEGFMMAMIQEFLPMINTTFADMGMDIYEFISEMFGFDITPETTVRKLGFNVSVEFDTASGALKALAIGAEADFTIATSTYGEYDEELGTYPEIKGTASAKISFNVSVNEISGTAATIAAPAKYTIVNDDYVG